MRLPTPRGPVSTGVVTALTGAPGSIDVGDPGAPGYADVDDLPAAAGGDALADEDLQLALATCYELHFRGFDGVDDGWEWEPGLLALRARLEHRFVAALRAGVRVDVAPDLPVPRALAALVDADDGPSLSAFLMREATLDQFRAFVAQRSVYHLREADPHTFAIPRLSGAAKAAMVEIQCDEYGGGRPERMHSALFARTLRALGLDATYGAHWQHAGAATFATLNAMSLFGLHRRWRGAAAGHLAALEMTSTGPNRRYANGLRRLGFGPAATSFYDEHVEADAVHEQVAAVDLCGSLVREEPELRDDVLFGAAVCLALDARASSDLLARFATSSADAGVAECA